MKTILTFLLLSIFVFSFGQQNDKITTLGFVQIQNDNREEVIYYYQNNWEVLRKRAIEEDYIHSYQLLEVPYSDEAPFHFVLITTYKDQKQYEVREENFAKLIEEKGPLRLMNDKKPEEFRKIIFNKEGVRHWN